MDSIVNLNKNPDLMTMTWVGDDDSMERSVHLKNVE